MKKKELILDFTSLLDVIMILLFVVIGNMSLATIETGAAAEQELAEKQAQVEELSGEMEELLSQIESVQELEQKNADLELELKVLQENYAALWDEYDYLKIVSDFDASDTSVYGKVIERMTKVVLLCETGKNEETGKQEVEVGVYLVSMDEERKSHVASVVLEHDFSLSKEERAVLVAEHVTEVTKVLSDALRGETEDIVWFSVQYSYDDENFSNSDLEIISEAIGNLERSFSKTCFIEKIKIY